MAYKVIHSFADKMDDFHVYSIGDKYPRNGIKISENRILELSGTNNDIGQALIEEIKSGRKKASEKEAK